MKYMGAFSLMGNALGGGTHNWKGRGCSYSLLRMLAIFLAINVTFRVARKRVENAWATPRLVSLRALIQNFWRASYPRHFHKGIPTGDNAPTLSSKLKIDCEQSLSISLVHRDPKTWAPGAILRVASREERGRKPDKKYRLYPRSPSACLLAPVTPSWFPW